MIADWVQDSNVVMEYARKRNETGWEVIGVHMSVWMHQHLLESQERVIPDITGIEKKINHVILMPTVNLALFGGYSAVKTKTAKKLKIETVQGTSYQE
jgi:hypothetical protein